MQITKIIFLNYFKPSKVSTQTANQYHYQDLAWVTLVIDDTLYLKNIKIRKQMGDEMAVIFPSFTNKTTEAKFDYYFVKDYHQRHQIKNFVLDKYRLFATQHEDYMSLTTTFEI